MAGKAAVGRQGAIVWSACGGVPAMCRSRCYKRMLARRGLRMAPSLLLLKPLPPLVKALAVSAAPAKRGRSERLRARGS